MFNKGDDKKHGNNHQAHLGKAPANYDGKAINNQVITTDNIESLKSQIIEIFAIQKQNELNLKQDLRQDMTQIIKRLEDFINYIEGC